MSLSVKDADMIARRVADRLNGNSQPFFTPKSLAAHLAISTRTVRTLLATGAIPSYMVGGARRIHPDDVDEYLQARREEIG